MLYRRYPSPMPLVTQMIRMHRFEEFVMQLVEMHNDEMEDKSMWEVWLHKIFDKSFAEFRDGITGKNTAAPTQEDIKSIAMDSMDILAGFVPDEGVVDRNGTVQAAGYDSD
jgi:hypothetical protein